ncbi:hypothetical protein EYF80_003402 [Liparis tanakae]|uniref:Uncharacterized protein n=1 Tax=Liparis tanakae TaxID=230148 RepID=A0A4Z2J8H8_9TELE|nr:hypothetical protein EYF80_003402 [Liparis tanakae]
MGIPGIRLCSKCPCCGGTMTWYRKFIPEKWTQDHKCHFLRVSDVEVAEDAEVGRGQGYEPTSLDHEARVVLDLKHQVSHGNPPPRVHQPIVVKVRVVIPVTKVAQRHQPLPIASYVENFIDNPDRPLVVDELHGDVEGVLGRVPVFLLAGAFVRFVNHHLKSEGVLLALAAVVNVHDPLRGDILVCKCHNVIVNGSRVGEVDPPQLPVLGAQRDAVVHLLVTRCVSEQEVFVDDSTSSFQGRKALVYNGDGGRLGFDVDSEVVRCRVGMC